MTDSTPKGRTWRGTAKRIAAVLGTLILLAAVVPFLIFAAPQVAGADHSFVILSGSMEPALSPGDVVIVDASASVAVGDIVTFRDGGEVPTTHRVVDVQDEGYVTKGDANENRDSRPVPASDLLGRVVFTIPLIGHIILWVNTPTGYVALVLVPALLFIGNELITWAWKRGPSGAQQTSAEGDDADTAESPSSTTHPIEESGSDPDADHAREATATVEDSPKTVAVAVADLKLSLLATGGLFAYAGWNVYHEVATVAAPNPVSVGALTGGLFGMFLAGWVSARAWHTARRDARSVDTSGQDGPRDLVPSAETDGGTKEGDR